ncbi:MAG TPA: threonine/serine exporter family protein [Erysipelothrix sp.]
MSITLQILSSFISSIAFGIIISVPKSSLVYVGITGALSWAVNLLLRPIFPNILVPIFLASVSVSILSIIFAKRLKMPATVFNLPGVFPLVPGITAFETMKTFMARDFMLGMELMMRTFAISMSIALAIVVTEVFYNAYIRIKNNKSRLKS